MQKSKDWLVMGPLNKIQYNIELKDGTKKTGYIRFTKYQQQQHEAVIKSSDNDVSQLAEIILNPEPNCCSFTKEQIEESLDIDEMRLLVGIWLNKKVINPSLSQRLDPGFF